MSGLSTLDQSPASLQEGGMLFDFVKLQTNSRTFCNSLGQIVGHLLLTYGHR